MTPRVPALRATACTIHEVPLYDPTGRRIMCMRFTWFHTSRGEVAVELVQENGMAVAYGVTRIERLRNLVIHDVSAFAGDSCLAIVGDAQSFGLRIESRAFPAACHLLMKRDELADNLLIQTKRHHHARV